MQLSRMTLSLLLVAISSQQRRAFGYLEDPRKMMFGTDWPLVSMKPYVEAYKRAIPKEHWRAVFHDNAVRVFKLQK